MAPTKQYMLNRALQELEAILANTQMSEGEIQHLVRIAKQEIENVIRQLDSEAS